MTRLTTHRFSALIVLIPCLAFASDRPQSRTVVLRGILHSAEFFGPPNYGENPESDRVETVYYLQLPASVDTQLGGGTEALATIFFVQLQLTTPHRAWAHAHLGSRVAAWGMLREWETGHERTVQVLDVDSLAAIANWRW